MTKLYGIGKPSTDLKSYYIRPAPYLEHFTFGYKDLVADLLLLRTIQDLDHCDRKISLEEKCTDSWVYNMVNKITDISPQFRIIYATVPLMLSMAVGDSQGAILLLEKGLRYFPKDWPILYRGGYLYLFDQKDKVKAAQYFSRAQLNGGPEWLASFATRLYTEAGQRELAQKLISEYEKGGISVGILQRMKSHLEPHLSR